MKFPHFLPRDDNVVERRGRHDGARPARFTRGGSGAFAERRKHGGHGFLSHDFFTQIKIPTGGPERQPEDGHALWA